MILTLKKVESCTAKPKSAVAGYGRMDFPCGQTSTLTEQHHV